MYKFYKPVKASDGKFHAVKDENGVARVAMFSSQDAIQIAQRNGQIRGEKHSFLSALYPESWLHFYQTLVETAQPELTNVYDALVRGGLVETNIITDPSKRVINFTTVQESAQSGLTAGYEAHFSTELDTSVMPMSVAGSDKWGNLAFIYQPGRIKYLQIGVTYEQEALLKAVTKKVLLTREKAIMDGLPGKFKGFKGSDATLPLAKGPAGMGGAWATTQANIHNDVLQGIALLKAQNRHGGVILLVSPDLNTLLDRTVNDDKTRTVRQVLLEISKLDDIVETKLLGTGEAMWVSKDVTSVAYVEDIPLTIAQGVMNGQFKLEGGIGEDIVICPLTSATVKALPDGNDKKTILLVTGLDA